MIHNHHRYDLRQFIGAYYAHRKQVHKPRVVDVNASRSASFSTNPVVFKVRGTKTSNCSPPVSPRNVDSAGALRVITSEDGGNVAVDLFRRLNGVEGH